MRFGELGEMELRSNSRDPVLGVLFCFSSKVESTQGGDDLKQVGIGWV